MKKFGNILIIDAEDPQSRLSDEFFASIVFRDKGENFTLEKVRHLEDFFSSVSKFWDEIPNETLTNMNKAVFEYQQRERGEQARKETAKAIYKNAEKALLEINNVLKNQKNLSKFGSALFDIASKTGSTFNTVAEVAKEFSSQSLGAQKTENSIKAKTPEAQKIWANVEEVAKQCPDWIKGRVKELAKEEVVKIARDRTSKEGKETWDMVSRAAQGTPWWMKQAKKTFTGEFLSNEILDAVKWGFKPKDLIILLGPTNFSNLKSNCVYADKHLDSEGGGNYFMGVEILKLQEEGCFVTATLGTWTSLT